MGALPNLVIGTFPTSEALLLRSVRDGGCLVFCARQARLAFGGVRISARPGVARGLSAVIAAQGRLVDYEDLTEAVWGHDPDGGPLDLEKSKHVLVHTMRRAAQGFGVRLRCVHSRGLIAESAIQRAAA